MKEPNKIPNIQDAPRLARRDVDLNFSFAEASDGGAIKGLLEEAGLPVDDLIDAHFANFVVCRSRGHLIAVAGLQPCGEVALLRSVAVGLGYRGQNIETRLVAFVEEQARLSRFSMLYLLTTTAEAFFAAHGYQALDRDGIPEAVRQTAEFASICPSSSVCMFKDLRPARKRTMVFARDSG